MNQHQQIESIASLAGVPVVKNIICPTSDAPCIPGCTEYGKCYVTRPRCQVCGAELNLEKNAQDGLLYCVSIRDCHQRRVDQIVKNNKPKPYTDEQMRAYYLSATDSDIRAGA